MRHPSRSFCLLRFSGHKVIGWVIADNLSDIRIRAGRDVTERMKDADITPGQHDLGDGYVLLVDIKD